MRYAGLCAFGRTKKDGEELFAPQRKYLGQRFPGSRVVTMTLPNLVDVSSTELRARIPKRETDGFWPPRCWDIFTASIFMEQISI